MKKTIILIVAYFLAVAPAWCQTTAIDFANEAFVVTRMVDKFHVEPRLVDSKFSSDVFTTCSRGPIRIRFTF